MKPLKTKMKNLFTSLLRFLIRFDISSNHAVLVNSLHKAIKHSRRQSGLFLFSDRFRTRELLNSFFPGVTRIAGIIKTLWHRPILVLWFIYFFLYFNPRFEKATSNAENLVYCPDAYAYRVHTDVYVSCENFDEYFAYNFNDPKRKALEFGSSK